MPLADDALVERVRQMQQRLHFVLHHPADGHARPVLDDGRDGLLVDAWKDERRLALQRRQLRLEVGQLRKKLRALLLGQGLRRGGAGGASFKSSFGLGFALAAVA